MRQPIAEWNSARDVWEVPGTASLFCGHLAAFSGTWPTSGMTRNGAAYALPTWADRTRGSASSSSPLFGTPRAAEFKGSGPVGSPSHAHWLGRGYLTAQVLLLPTPEAKLADSGPDFARAGREGSGGNDLTTALALLPTPTVQDGKNTGGPSQFERNTPPLNTAVLMSSAWGDYAPAIERWETVMGPAPAPVVPGPKGGPRLSPAFTEWMMGQPAGWITDPAIGISRNDQIKACGNGVVTQQAVAALLDMLGGPP